MVKGAAAVAGLGLALTAFATGAQAASDDKSGGRSCFYSQNISSFRAADRSTVYLRVGVSDFYELKLLGDCPHIDWAEHLGLEHRGSPWICSGLDAMLIVPQGAGLRPLRCAVSTLRRLSPAEVKAMPRKDKP
jgi:hypothetical protein